MLFLSISAPADDTVEIRGRVQSIGGKPIAGAVVLQRAGQTKTTTAEDGTFVLAAVAKGRIVLEVVHPDYVDGEFALPERLTGSPVTLSLMPLIRQSEEVVVTALRYPESAARVPAAETVLTATTLQERMTPNITEALAGVPGFVALGSGGFSLVPTIRGLARNRILILIDNARIASDRRTGPSASFLNPEDVERIEVLRSPSSIFYGSDAIGGVIHLITRRATEEGIHGVVHAGYGTNNDNGTYGASLAGKKGAMSFYLSGQRNTAGNYASPLGEVLVSNFDQASLYGRITYETEDRFLDLSLLGARGTDIGKPARDSLTKPTWYPRENQNLARFQWKERNLGGGELNVQGFANPNFLETRTNRVEGLIPGESPGYVSKATFARTESTEYGLQVSYARRAFESLRLIGGLDIFGRAAARAVNTETTSDPAGATTGTFAETPFTDGARSDVGFFLSADYAPAENLDLIGGLRFDVLTQAAHPGGGAERQESKRNAVTGFAAVSYRVTDSLTAFVNFSRAYRTPGLSELFYSGITGRGFIIAQPDLRPETSLNADAGLRYIRRRVYIGAYVFRYGIDGLIDRYLVAEKTYTYGNLEDVRIRGLELEFEFYPLVGWKLFGNLLAMSGESRETGAAVNDIPPFRAVFGSRIWIGKLSLEVNGTTQAKKDTPGPAEVAIPAYDLVQIRASYQFRPVSLFASLQNVFDRTFMGRPDPDAVEEPGRRIVLGLRWAF